MPTTKYDKLFVRGAKPGVTDEFMQRYVANLDDDVIKGSYYFGCTFMQPKYSTGIHSPHFHPYAEVLYFQAIDPDNPIDLGWEIDIFLGKEFERFTVTKTTAIFMPPRFIHNPIISRMKKPVFHIYCMTGPVLVSEDYNGTINQANTFDKIYGQRFIRGPKPGETREKYKQCTTYVDDDVMKGSFHFASSFISSSNPLREDGPHTYPFSVALGFFGNNPDDQFDLGAEVEVLLGKEAEKHTFSQSALLYIPPGLTYHVTKCKARRPFIFVESANTPRLT